jgi:hypothetical protein
VSKWKDISTFSQGDTDRTPNAFQLNAGAVRIVVHHHIYHRDAWLVSCHELRLDCRDLDAATADEAKRKAVEVVRARLEESLEQLGKGGD